MSAQTIIGASMPRRDAMERVTGEVIYGMDFALPGMLHGAVLRSTEPHARIVSIDTAAAQALPGVRAVLTAADINPKPIAFYIDDEPVLARDIVRYEGEPVALVAATSAEIAREATRHITVTYEPLPPILDPEEAARPDAPLVHEAWQSYRADAGMGREGNIAGRSELRHGDPEAAFAAADQVVSDRYTTQSVHQMYLEPAASVVTVSSNGDATIYSNTQLPFRIRGMVAAVLEIPESRVRVVSKAMGGGFGAKLFVQVEHFCALLARATGRPVRMADTVEDSLIAGYPRHPAVIEIRTALKDGRITGREARMILDTGAYAGPGPKLAPVPVLVLCGPYAIPNIDVSVRAVYTNKQPFGSYRAPTGPQANFALESHMDHVARELGVDPLQLRLDYLLEDGEETANGQLIEASGLRECLERAAAAIEWNVPAGPNRGKGIACGWWTTTGGPSGCFAKLEADGKIAVHVGALEIGTGAVSHGTAQIWADAMGVDVEDIVIVSGDTDANPYDLGSQGSRTLFNLGNVALRTAEALKDQLKVLAADILEAAPEDLEVVDKGVRVKGSPEAWVSLADLARQGQARQGGILAHGAYTRPATPFDPDRTYGGSGTTFNAASYFCHAAEVEIDPVTGEVTVLRYAAAHDVGHAINPPGIVGQIDGGVVQGLGMAMMEEIGYIDGHVQNGNLTDYKIPTFADAPEIEAIVVEHPNAEGPLGAKGVGEAPVIAPPATIANAVEAAVGVRIADLPITPEKVLRAMDQRHAPW